MLVPALYFIQNDILHQWRILNKEVPEILSIFFISAYMSNLIIFLPHPDDRLNTPLQQHGL